MYLKKSNSHPDYDHQKHLCTIFSRKTGYSANLKKISLYCLTRVHNRYNVHKIPQGKPSQKMGLWKYKAWWLSHVTCSHLFSSTACWALSRFFFFAFTTKSHLCTDTFYLALTQSLSFLISHSEKYPCWLYDDYKYLRLTWRSNILTQIYTYVST